jgi:hypothetical protein
MRFFSRADLALYLGAIRGIVKGLNRPFSGFGRGVVLENVTLDALRLLPPFGEKRTCRRHAKKGTITCANGFQKLLPRD